MVSRACFRISGVDGMEKHWRRLTARAPPLILCTASRRRGTFGVHAASEDDPTCNRVLETAMPKHSPAPARRSNHITQLVPTATPLNASTVDTVSDLFPRVRPLQVCSAALSPAKRPRLFWLSWRLRACAYASWWADGPTDVLPFTPPKAIHQNASTLFPRI